MTPHDDKSGGLALAGGCAVLVGGLALACAGLLLVLGRIGAVTRASPEVASGASGLAYVPVGAYFIAVGVGAMLVRRWGWALLLTTAWIWLAYCAVAVTGGLVLGVTGLVRGRGDDATLMAVGFLFLAFGAAVLAAPGWVAVSWLSHEAVQRTVERRDPAPSWTDRIPRRVLAPALLFAGGGAMSVGLAAGAQPFLLGPWLLRGMPASAAHVALGIAWIVLAWGIAMRRSWSWWAVLAVVVVVPIGYAVSAATGAVERSYEAMGIPAADVTSMMAVVPPVAFAILIGLVDVAAIAYLVWIRPALTGSPR